MSSSALREADLFGTVLPDGLVYRSAFISEPEEVELLAIISRLPFQEALYRQYTARRRIVSYGFSYDFSHQKLDAGPPLPEFLFALREKVGRWLCIPAPELEHALINEYQPGTPLGWHRDTPEFGTVAGISLAGPARMRWRRYPPGKRAPSITLEVEPRSAYVMRGEARWHWQHSVSPTKELRYSITFRTVRCAE
jgi:alkylated DNA repair dioxygenase AlkB